MPKGSTPGNAFWRQLSASGLVARVVGPEDDALLMDEAGIGFTDLCGRPTVRADELNRAELTAGALRLLEELMSNQPKIALFSGRGVYQQFGRHALGLAPKGLAGREYGPQPEQLGASIPWVIPSSSGLASGQHALRLEWLRRLAEELGASGEG